jgi:hypothetical protein
LCTKATITNAATLELLRNKCRDAAAAVTGFIDANPIVPPFSLSFNPKGEPEDRFPLEYR